MSSNSSFGHNEQGKIIMLPGVKLFLFSTLLTSCLAQYKEENKIPAQEATGIDWLAAPESDTDLESHYGI